jgi:hypothetical protein
MPCPHSQRILAGQVKHGLIGTTPAHQALAAGLAERQAKLDARHRPHQRFVEIFHGFDKMRLPQNEINWLGLFNLNDLNFHAFLLQGQNFMLLSYSKMLIGETGCGNLP